MSYHFFAIPALDPAAAQAELNAFCARHRVLQVERQFVNAGVDSHWALCVQVAEGPGPLPAALKARAAGAAGAGAAEAAPGAAAQPRIDWKQVLGEAEFGVFARLRQERKALAEREGVPVYAVFTNEQLAAMVRQRAATPAALQGIEGVGPARLARYGPAMLAILVPAYAQAPAPGTATGAAA
jgi:superfamily II DNA helicase RecQ